jgi:hypothetical protein
MFDLAELDRADAALHALVTGRLPAAPREAAPTPTHAAARPAGDISRCPFHNGTLRHEDGIAA